MTSDPKAPVLSGPPGRDNKSREHSVCTSSLGDFSIFFFFFSWILKSSSASRGTSTTISQRRRLGNGGEESQAISSPRPFRLKPMSQPTPPLTRRCLDTVPPPQNALTNQLLFSGVHKSPLEAAETSSGSAGTAPPGGCSGITATLAKKRNLFFSFLLFFLPA